MFPNTLMLGMEIRVKVADYVRDKITALRKYAPPPLLLLLLGYIFFLDLRQICLYHFSVSLDVYLSLLYSTFF